MYLDILGTGVCMILLLGAITTTGCWFGTFFYFPFHIWDVILPIDELFFFMVKTTNQTRLCQEKCFSLITGTWISTPRQAKRGNRGERLVFFHDAPGGDSNDSW